MKSTSKFRMGDLVKLKGWSRLHIKVVVSDPHPVCDGSKHPCYYEIRDYEERATSSPMYVYEDEVLPLTAENVATTLAR